MESVRRKQQGSAPVPKREVKQRRTQTFPVFRAIFFFVVVVVVERP